MPTMTITWHTKQDARVCQICQSLEGYTWTFDTAVSGALPEELVHPGWGVVWTKGEGSNAHGHSGNCRCRLDPEFDFSDWLTKVQDLERQIAGAHTDELQPT